jgi:2,3-bisphosphoglycerate-independent phosphoglycerate mutase
VQPFRERHGLRGAMVAPTKIIAGLGLSLGLELLACPGATGDYRSDFGAKVGLLWTQAARLVVFTTLNHAASYIEGVPAEVQAPAPPVSNSTAVH